jgi:hypothetical protein
MLLPRFTIRSLLALTALSALVAWVLQQAWAGALWAQCAGWTLVFVGVLFGTYAALFLVAWIAGQILGIVRPTYTPMASPFAKVPAAGKYDVQATSPFREPQSSSPSS